MMGENVRHPVTRRVFSPLSGGRVDYQQTFAGILGRRNGLLTGNIKSVLRDTVPDVRAA